MKLWLRNSKGIWAAVLMMVLSGAGLAAAQGDAKPAQADAKPVPNGWRPCPTLTMYDLPEKSFIMHSATSATDGNEILTALRLILDPSTKLYLVSSQSMILIRGCPADVDMAAKLLAQMDNPHRNFRLTYTITETEGGKRIGLQHVTMVVQNGQRMVLKNGSRVPIVTGALNQTNGSAEQQMTYLDIGLSFDATASSPTGELIALKTKVEQSSVAEEKSGVGPQDPVVRQSVLEGETLLTPGKPQVLGSFDVTGSTRHIEIEVMAEAVK